MVMLNCPKCGYYVSIEPDVSAYVCTGCGTAYDFDAVERGVEALDALGAVPPGAFGVQRGFVDYPCRSIVGGLRTSDGREPVTLQGCFEVWADLVEAYRVPVEFGESGKLADLGSWKRSEDGFWPCWDAQVVVDSERLIEALEMYSCFN